MEELYELIIAIQNNVEQKDNIPVVPLQYIADELEQAIGYLKIRGYDEYLFETE